jgi:NAD(P)-dependent dehydrogenase (short-subunit alcohol dehydrogenase family)
MISIFKQLVGKLLNISFLVSCYVAKFWSLKAKKSNNSLAPTSVNSSGLEGKVVIVTGASGGVGLATTTALLAAGCKVFALDIVPAPKITHDNFAFLRVNLTEERAPEQIVDLCQEVYGRIDALLNIAGLTDKLASVEHVTDQDWDRIIAVNLTAPVRLMRAVVKVMKKQGKGGVVVNVASKAGTSGAVAGVAYTSSKHGLVGATKNTAFLMKSDGIRCNAICPGVIATPMNAPPDFSKFDLSSMMKIKAVSELVMSPLTGSGMLDPSAFTSMVLFLLSDGAEAINGAIIPIDNAWSTL